MFRRVCLLAMFLLTWGLSAQTSVEALLKSYPSVSAQKVLAALLAQPVPASPDYDAANRHVQKAQAAQTKGDSVEAFREDCRAAALVPHHEWYLMNAGIQLLWNQHDDEGAAAFLEASAAIKPSVLALSSDALAEQHLAKNEAAEKGYRAALDLARQLDTGALKAQDAADLKRDRESSYGLYVHFLTDTQRWEDAVQTAREALASDPDTTDWYLVDGAGTAAFRLANRDFGLGHFDKAVAEYQTAVSLYQKNADLWKFQQSYADLTGLLHWAQVRRDMKEVKPDTRFQVLVIVLRHADLKFVNGQGKPIQGKTDVTDDQISGLHDSLWMLGPLCEALSGGRFTVEFQEQVVDATLKGIQEDSFTELGKSSEVDNTDLNRISPALGDLWRTNLGKFDGFATFWNAAGLVNGGNGGLTAFPLVAYTVGSPLRAMMNIPVAGVPSPASYIFFFHELFHNIEGLADIAPVHGFRPGVRDSFPAWKGSTELDYYAWQFQTTLPHLSAKSAAGTPLAGFLALDVRSRWPDNQPATLVDGVQGPAEKLSWDVRQQARQLADKADKAYFEQKDVKTAASLYNQALKLNPWLPDAWVHLGQVALERGDKAEALEDFRRPALWGTGSWETVQYADLLSELKKDNKTALVFLKKGLDLAHTPQDAAQAYFRRAELLRQDGQAQAAADDYASVLQANPDPNDEFYLTAWFWRAELALTKLGQTEDGLRQMTELAKTGKAQVWHFENVVYEMQWNLKDLPTARKLLELELATVTDPAARANADYNLGRLAWDEHKAQESLGWFQRVMTDGGKKHPLYPEAWFWTGLVTGEGLGDIPSGLAIMEKAIAAGYDNAFSRGYRDAWKPKRSRQ